MKNFDQVLVENFPMIADLLSHHDQVVNIARMTLNTSLSDYENCRRKMSDLLVRHLPETGM